MLICWSAILLGFLLREARVAYIGIDSQDLEYTAALSFF